MSRLQEEIMEAMSGFEKTEDGKLTAHFCFAENFAGFQGHFAGNPVLPGICKIQAVLALFEAAYYRPFRLKEVSAAKYMLPVTCHEEILVECQPGEPRAGFYPAKAVVYKGAEKVAMLQLILEDEES